MLGNNATLQTFRSDFSVDIFFSQNLTMLRFPYGKICFLFPLAKDQSTPEKLMRDLEKAKKVRTQMCFKNRFCQKRKKNYAKIHAQTEYKMANCSVGRV